MLTTSEAILQKKRKEILEKKIEFYKELVKQLMGDKDIQEELMENPELEAGASSLVADGAKLRQKKTDIRSLL